jgi:succinate dehydrogenase/fumarate reductase flavoprotein subunit
MTMKTIPKKWDEEADVVVVGYGGAGAIAAITAHDEGADVLILEKAPEGEEGGNTRVSGNIWFTPEPSDKAITYFKAMCGDYEIPEKMIEVWAEEMGKNNQLVVNLGGEPSERKALIVEFPDLPGVECVHVYVNGSETSQFGGDEALWVLLRDCVKKRGIKVLFETPGKRLIQNPKTGEILGVIAQRIETEIAIKAKRAVVLTCGGFENNLEMVRNYLTNLPCCYPKGTPYNTGDGIKMALDVGADLWHMQNIAGPQYSFKLPDRDVVMYPRKMPGNSYVYVAGTGERFVSEQAYLIQTPDGPRYPVKHGKIWKYGQWIPSPTPPSIHCIFDEKTRRKGPIYGGETYKLGWVEVLKLYDWSENNTKEIERGWIERASTISELAKGLGLPPSALEDTINKYNDYCKRGKDPDFDRDPKSLEPIDEPLYYGMPLVPNFINTQGGPRRNEKAQIVNPYGGPIRRLYSAGELGSIYGFLYQGGGNIGECLAFGKIAGKNAATEKPWK